VNDYRIFGLRLRSAVALPGLVEAGGQGEPQVIVRLGESPPWAAREDGHDVFSSEPDEGEVPALVATRFDDLDQQDGEAPAALRLRYAEGITFWIPLDGGGLWTTWDDPLTLADAMTFLTGPALGVVLRLRGVLALHASAVVVRGRAVGFVGPGGAGKSTLAALFGLRGYPVLTDDVLALHRDGAAWMAQPAAPQLRIWEDSEHLVLGAQSRLAPLTASWPKRGLALAGGGLRFQDGPIRLDALVFIGDPVADPSASTMESVGGRDAILGLVENTYTNYLLDDAQRADEMRAIGALVGAVRIARLRPAHDGDVAALVSLVDRWIG
jgi:hypothetical protein